MNVQEKYDLLASSLQELGYTLFKGYPVFGTPSFQPPYLALVFAGEERNTHDRIGKGNITNPSFRIFIAASNEVELLEMIDAFKTWQLDHFTLKNDDGVIVRLSGTVVTRNFDLAEIEGENYVAITHILME